jgi:NADPH:quinone reductase-like Zn-dependent oxidoreductase
MTMITTTMRAWQLSAHGLHNLKNVSLPVPRPNAGELLIEVAAASLNYRDKLVAEGGYFPIEMSFPFIPASDMVGRVVEVGAGVTRFREGDRVSGNFRTRWLDNGRAYGQAEHGQTLGGPLPGVLAQYIVLPEDVAVAVPPYLSDAEAATLPIAALTPWVALAELGHLRAGQVVLVQGTGGVSLFALQIARMLGAEVIVTSRDDGKLDRARQLGASETINTVRHPQWSEKVLRLTGGTGVQHIIDVIGGEGLRQSVDAIADEGRITSIGFLSSNIGTFDILPLLAKRALIQGNSVGSRPAFERMNKAFETRELHPVIGQLYEFDDVPAAFSHLERGAFGKIVIRLER